jgi:hypothetical protein
MEGVIDKLNMQYFKRKTRFIFSLEYKHGGGNRGQRGRAESSSLQLAAARHGAAAGREAREGACIDGLLRQAVSRGREEVGRVERRYLKGCIDSLGETIAFTTVACNSWYRKIPVHQADHGKTKFTSDIVIYQFLDSHFGCEMRQRLFNRPSISNFPEFVGKHVWFIWTM